MFVNRTHGVVAATLGALSLGLAGCEDATQDTDLRAEGPPDVLAVLVLTDAGAQLYEEATYCRPNDAKRPGLVGLPDITTHQICPESLSEGADMVTNAYPDGWYIRIMFDELLDPEVETLTEVIDEDGNGTDTFVGSIADTHPVTLRCESVNGGMVEVDYDGYYSPAGNRITWPLGPSLVIRPNDATLIGTGSRCEVTINDVVTDKDGTAVETGQRGPYTFEVAPIQVLVVDPADDPDGEAPIDASVLFTDGIYVQFNTAVDPASLCDEGTGMDECEFTFTPAAPTGVGQCSVTGDPCLTAMNGADCAPAGQTCGPAGVYALSLVPFGFTETEFAFGPNLPAEVNKSYEFKFTGGTVADRCGNETTLTAGTAADMTLVRYKTNPFKIKNANIVTGETASPLKKLQLLASNIIDSASLETTEYTLTPAPTGAVNSSLLGNDVAFLGHYALNTEYTFTLNAGATVEDVWGVEYTNATPLTVTWKTQPAISATFTADNTTFTKATDTSLTGVTITFNTSIVTTDLTAPATRTTDQLTEGTEYTVTGPGNAAVTGFTIDTSSNTGCTVGGTSCAIRIRKNLAAGDYTFTLKAGAALTDVLGNVYTQAMDRVIHFTVENPPPPSPPCL
jgi:hypothetical protein